MQIKCCSFFNFMFIVYFGKKKAHASSICKLFLFPKSNNPKGCQFRKQWRSLLSELYGINSVDSTKSPCYTLPTMQHCSLAKKGRNLRLFPFVWAWGGLWVKHLMPCVPNLWLLPHNLYNKRLKIKIEGKGRKPAISMEYKTLCSK